MKSSKLITGLIFLLAISMLNIPSNIGQTNIEEIDNKEELDLFSPNTEFKENSVINTFLEQKNEEVLLDPLDQKIVLSQTNGMESSSFEKTEDENNQNQPSWLELARMSISGLSATGTLQVNTQIGSTILQNAPIEVRNSTNHIVASGVSDVNGNKTFILNNESYYVIVQQDNNITLPVFVVASSTTTVTADFGYLNITTQDDLFTYIDTQIEVRSNSVTEISNLQTGVDGNLVLIVAPKVYDVVAIYSYGDTKPGVIVTSGLTTDVIFTFGDISGKFGGLEVRSSGFFSMPLTSQVDIYYYPSLAYAAGGQTNGGTGKGFWNLAPDVYTVIVREFSSISFDIVTIQDSVQTNLTVSWGTLIVYQDVTTNTFVELYDVTNTNRLNYGWIDGTGKFVINAHSGQYVVRYSGFNYVVNVMAGDRQLINSQRNVPLNLLNPTQPYTYVTAGRVYANEQTNISIQLTDPDYDYQNFSFTWTPNVGTVTGINTWNRFQWEHQFISTVTYNAPTTNQTMYVDILVDDNNGGNYSYRIYLSNRVGTISVNSTQLGGVPRSNTFIDLYRSNGLRITYGWANANGWVNFTNVLEDEYIVYGTESNVQNTGIFFLNGSETKLVNFKWGLLSVNSTALNGQLIDTAVEARSADGSVYYSSGITTLSGNGYYTFFLAQGNYSLAGYEFNDYWAYGFEVIEEKQIFHEFKFGVVAAYYLDEQSNPQPKFVQVYNQTSGIRENYGWMSGLGLLVMILVPYNNYSILVDHNTTLTYIYGNITNPLVLLPNQGLNIGQFINHDPIVSAYLASPARVSPNQTSVITITASDPDPLDILTYIYTPSMGIITGSGNVVNYTAPATTGFYYLNISVSDPHGSEVNFSRSLSNRVGDISITVLGYNNVTLNSYFVELWDTLTGLRYTYGWTTPAGKISFLNVYESFYIIRAHAHNTWDSEIFIPGPDTGLYSKTFRFSSLFVNATGGQNQLVQMNTEVHFNSVYQNNLNTLTTGTGQNQFLLRPDVYDVRGLMVNDQWYNGISLIGKEADSINLTFSWAEFNISVRAGNYMPMDSFVEIYNSSLSSRYTYAWPSAATGSLTWFGRPGNFYQLRATEASSTIFIEFNTTAGNLYNLDAHFGTVRLLGSDINDLPTNVAYNVYFNNTSTYVGGGSTGADGAIFIHLAPGYYDITNGTYTFQDILVTPLQVLQIGSNSVNNYPAIIAVTPSPARIGPNASTTIVLEASDIDYDYPIFSVDLSINTGSVDPGTAGWTQKNRWRYTFVYHSPMSSGFYEINITLNDGRGLSRTFTLHISNQQALLNIKTLGNALRSLQSSSVVIYNVYTGASIASGSTDVNGLYSTFLYDDLYNIRVGQHNYMWSYNVWARNGEIVNVTFLFGEITIHATGVNDVPLQNAFIEVYNQTTLVRYTYGWTPVDGKLHFILAPGLYRIVITPSGGTAITFNSILIEGGSGLALGSAVPNVSRPTDVSYEEGSTGNEVLWTLSDLNPNTYYITLDGVIVVNSTNWATGQTVIFNIDGLFIGEHALIIFVNDTTGLEQTDIVFITVYSDSASPFVTFPNQVIFNKGTFNNRLIYSVVDSNPDKYILYRDSIVINSGPWVLGNLIFNLDSLDVGTYQYQLFVNDTLGNNFTTGFTLVTVNQPVLNPDIPPQISISSPPDKSLFSNETSGVLVTWSVLYFNGLGESWFLSINGIIYQTGSVTNNTNYSFNLGDLNLGSGLHRLVFTVTVKDSNSNFVSGIDYVHITIKKVQSISAGTTNIDLGGVTNTTISLTVDSSVELTVETLPAPTSSTSSAFQALETSQGAINTGYFLDITISDESAIQDVWINISYAGWDLASLGITDESTLKIYFFDEDIGDWVPAGNTGADTVRKIIYANVDHFSAYAAVAFVANSETSGPDTSITSIDTSSQTTERGIPGFKFFSVILSIIVTGLIYTRKRKEFSK